MTLCERVLNIFQRSRFFKSITDGTIYLLVYWMIPTASIIGAYLNLKDSQIQNSILTNMNFNYVILVSAAGTLSDCYSRWNDKRCAANFKVMLVAVLNVILFCYAFFTLTTALNGKMIEFKSIICIYAIFQTMFTFIELIKVIAEKIEIDEAIDNME